MLRTCFVDFQRIVGKPQGDGGLDGLSHDQEHAYCMYGPTFDPKRRKTLPKQLEKDIIKKFKGDLRKLFELKGRDEDLLFKENTEIKTILADGKKIQHIRLIVNNYESHQILGPLNTAKSLYCSVSRCAHVADSVSLVVWGPKDLSELTAVDEQMLFRAEQRQAQERLEQAIASSAKPAPDCHEFDEKFDWLVAEGRMSDAQVARIRGPLLDAWTKAILLDRHLANIAPSLHRRLEQVRASSVVDAALQPQTALEAINGLRAILRERLESELLPALSKNLLQDAANGETARFIGECPLDWRQE